ncbi:unnamed protein product, partial [Cuscuta campestris]
MSPAPSAPKSFAQAVAGSSTPGISLRANVSRPCAILPNVVVEDKIPTVHRIQFTGQFPMRLFRWSPEFNVKTESSVAPVWVTFPSLRADLFNESAIHQLCKPIGRCLKVDIATSNFSHPNVAKARVEIDLLKPRIEQIWIGFSDVPGEEDVGMFQSVEYERIPKYCTACFKQGHDNSSCNTLTPSQPDQRTVVVVPQPSTAAPTNTQPPRRRRSKSRVRRQREGKGIALDDAGANAGGSQREESQYVWREKTAKGSRPIEVVDVNGLGKGEGPSSGLQAFVPTSSHPSPNVVIPEASLAPSSVNATIPIPVVVEQSASLTLEPSAPPTGVEPGSVVASLPLLTSSSSPIVHVPDPHPPELALVMSNTFDALGEMPGDSHEVCGFNTAASSIPSNSVRKEDDDCSSQTSDGSTGDHFEDPTDIARDLAASGLSPAREAPTTREHEDFQRVVADSWREDIAGSPMFIFGAKLKRLAHSLKRWNRDTFGHIFDRLKTLEQDVRDIELQLQTDPSDETYIEFKRRSALLKRQYRIEDEFWRQ